MHIVWLTYPVFLFSSAARFRFFQQHSDIQWGVENLYIGPACGSHCGGHGDCLDQRCLCDPGFTGPNCYASTPLKVESGSHSIKKSDHKRRWLRIQICVYFFCRHLWRSALTGTGQRALSGRCWRVGRPAQTVVCWLRGQPCTSAGLMPDRLSLPIWTSAEQS